MELVAQVSRDDPGPVAPALSDVDHGHQVLAAAGPPGPDVPDTPADEEAAQDDTLSARQEADHHQGGAAPVTRVDLILGIVVIVI